MAKSRTVIALSDIEQGQTVVVDTATHPNEAWPTNGPTRTLEPTDPHILAKAVHKILRGQSGEVEELENPN